MLRLFKPVKDSKIREEIASQVKKAIFAEKLRPGDRLPTEKELVEIFQASKATIREALRVLETTGFIEIRRGAMGGPYVAKIDLQNFTESLVAALRLGNASINELTETRLILEPNIARLAVQRATEADLRALKENIQQMEAALESGREPGNLNLEFHRLVAQASKNSVLILNLNSVIDILQELVVKKLQLSAAARRNIITSHRQICKAIEVRDEKKALKLMQEHVAEVHTKLWGVYLASLKQNKF